MVILISVLLSLIGLLMYAFAANPKLQEVGRIMFAFGFLAFLLQLGPFVANVLPK